MLQTPVVRNDALLRIRTLALMGTIDLNLNTAAALEDWTQVRDIAASIGDEKWENRANGDLGLVAGVSGNISAAGLALYSAIGKAEKLGDTAAYIYFSTWLANGMAVNGMADRATEELSDAIAFAKKNGFTELPLQLSIARIRALMNLPEPQREQGLAEAAKLIKETLAQAQREHVAGAETEILNAAGQLVANRNDVAAAEKAYSQAMEVASAASLPREEAEACLNLSRFYRSQKQYTKAASIINRGIRAIQRVEEAYDLPVLYCGAGRSSGWSWPGRCRGRFLPKGHCACRGAARECSEFAGKERHDRSPERHLPRTLPPRLGATPQRGVSFRDYRERSRPSVIRFDPLCPPDRSANGDPG